MEIKKDTFDYSNCNYRDRFDLNITDAENRIGISDIAQLFAGPGPKWVRWLFALRNRIVAVFGLKTDFRVEDNTDEQGAPGLRCGIFEVYSRTDTDMLLGEDDKHLNFRISLSIEALPAVGKRISITTFVKYNNCLGRVYFFFVRPFHRIIVPALMKHKLRQLELDAARL